jgi:hypothetical protein
MHLQIPSAGDPDVPFRGRSLADCPSRADFLNYGWLREQDDDLVGLSYDLDGCAHRYDTAKKNAEGKIHRAPDDGLFIWAPLLYPLLLEFPKLRLVCHSTWRNLYTFAELKQQLPPELAARTVAMTRPHQPRHKSILECTAAMGLTHFVILDDDPWEFPHNLSDLVVVPSETGLSAPGAVDRLRAAILEVIRRQVSTSAEQG